MYVILNLVEENHRIFYDKILLHDFIMYLHSKRNIQLIIWIMLFLQYSINCYNRINPFIRRLIFSGGEVKGILYPGSLKALEEAQIIQNVKEISGCSIGAVMAGFVAVGMSSETFRTVTLQTDFQYLLGERHGFLFKRNTPGCFPISKTGLPLEHWIRDQLQASVSQFFANNQNYYGLHELKERFYQNNSTELTFADLDLLNKYVPERFKKLTVVATHFPEGTLAIFNAKTSPSLDIAKAIRASASLPIVLTPITINGTLFMDGGLVDNLPDYFELEEMTNKQKDKTLLFTFNDELDDKNSALFRALHGSEKEQSTLFQPSLFDYFKLNYLLKWILGLKNKELLTDKIEANYQRIRQEYPLRTVALGPGKLKTMDFINAKKLTRIMWAFGYIDTLNFLVHHDLAQEKKTEFVQLLHYFASIYSSILSQSDNKNIQNKLLEEVHSLLNNKLPWVWSKPNPYQELLYSIKKQAEAQPDCLAAFSLSLAVEYYHQYINSSELQKQIAEKVQEKNRPVQTKRWHFFKSITNTSDYSLQPNHSISNKVHIKPF